MAGPTAGKSESVDINQISFEEEGLWKGRSTKHKCLVVALFIFFLLAVVFFIAFLVVYLDADDDSSSEREVCSTHDCLQTAAYLSNSLNESVDPCEDFYEFACGGWRASHSIAADKNSVDNFGLADDKNTQVLRAALEANPPDQIPGLRKVRTFYKACVDTVTADEKGVQPLKELLLSEGMDLFPTLNPSWTDDGGWNTWEVVRRISEIGYLFMAPFVKLSVTLDKGNASVLTYEFDQTSLSLQSQVIYTGERQSAFLVWYEKVYADILVALGANPATAAADATQVVDLEVELAKILDSNEKQADIRGNYNKMTVKQLQDRFPQFQWLEYLRMYVEVAGVEVTNSSHVVVMALDYYDQLFPLLQNTTARTLLNYGMWKMVFSLASSTGTVLRDIQEPLLHTLYGIAESPERWLTCVKESVAFFPEHVGRLFIDYGSFTPQALEKVVTMVNELREVFREILHETDWMEQSTKDAALEKLRVMGQKVGYPDYIMDDEWINTDMAKLNGSEGDYFGNTLNFLRFQREYIFRYFKEPFDKGRWVFSPAKMNAVYSPQLNEIILPASILQTPFFDETFPDVLNYAAIGSIIGHEITHGFDATGRGFDKGGSLASWWQEEDDKKFLEKAECFVKQYAEFQDPVLAIKVNGMLTLSENIADNAGMKEAYRAYRKLMDSRGEEGKPLPVLPYSVDQLFYIGSAQAWCARIQDNFRQLLLQTDAHSPNRFRVIGTLQNSQHFAESFSCPSGSYMNPPNKCSVW